MNIATSMIVFLSTAFGVVSAFGAIDTPSKIVFSFQKQKAPEALTAAATKVARALEAEIKKPIDVVVPVSYGTTVQGLIAGTVHVAYMDSLPFILANSEVPLEILAVEERNTRTDYDSLMVVAKDSPIKTLADLKGKRMAFTSATSTSGYLMPYFRLVRDGFLKVAQNPNQFFSQVIFAGGYDKALQAVVTGQADVAAFSDYVIEGAKADLYGTAADRAKVRVLARTSGVPTHLLACRKDLPEDLKQKVRQTLLTMAQKDPQLIASVYGAAKLLPVSTGKSHVQQTQDALRLTGIKVGELVK